MRIVRARQISQVFFLLLFLWFCVVASVGEKWWQLRGWPVNWFLQLDPLVALATAITTRTLYAGLLWALVTVVLTILLGRFFCGWVCPFGTLHHFVGFLGSRKKRVSEKAARNRYHRAQCVKYFLLVLLLGAAAGASVQIGLLDPIALMHRSVDLVVLPLVDGSAHKISVSQRYTDGAWLIGAVFLSAVLINLKVPRFYCRFVCPLGALFGVLGRYALWRIGKGQRECVQCEPCEAHCEGACEPSGKIRISECVLCMNCLDACHEGLIGYRTSRSEAGEITSPDLTRRGFVVSLLSGVLAVPMMRLGGTLSSNWSPGLIRPPGALAEKRFLQRCIKCGQCMRVCPTNVVHPSVLQGGLEGFWAPVLNFRAGTSGCQYNCVACGHVCPTGAIRPISLDEKHGKNGFAAAGPIRLGTAFVDQGRCLPWAMDRPCIVCQENCPVSPKAIFTREHFIAVRDGQFLAKAVSGFEVVLDGGWFRPGAVATGDYFFRVIGKEEDVRWQILDNSESVIVLSSGHPFKDMPEAGSRIEIQIRLKRPYIDPKRCTGCGICEHECPVTGLRAIRVTAENESRNKGHALLL